MFELVTLSDFIRELIFLHSYQTIGKIIKAQNWPTEKHLLHLAPGKDGRMYEKSEERSASMWKLPNSAHSHKHSYKYVYIYERFIFMNMLLLHYLPWLLHKVKRKTERYWSLSGKFF